MKNKIVDHDILQFPNNFILKGVIPLENIFDNNNVLKTSLLNTEHQEDVEDFNTGNDGQIKNVRILASLLKDIKDIY